MRSLPVICSALVLLGGASQAGTVSSASFERTITKKVALRYAVYIPEGYSEKGGPYPTILFLHGAGERGDDLSKVTSLPLVSYARNTVGFPFIVIAPQCASGEQWSNDALIALLDEAQRKYRVDPDRVYLTGFSMGGTGVWSLAMEAPSRFAAIAPLCGRVVPLLAYRLFETPVWAFHGEKDDVISVSQSKEMVEALKGMGATKVKLTAYPDEGHNIWYRAHADPELYKWFLEHRRKAPAKQ